jgi:putative transport protein
MFLLSEISQNILTVFLVVLLGILLGRISIKGVRLGFAAIFLVGLVFGHLGFGAPPVLQSMGLVLFIVAVGLSAGPTFLEKLRQSGKQYSVLCAAVVLSGALVCLGIIKLGRIDNARSEESAVCAAFATGAESGYGP